MIPTVVAILFVLISVLHSGQAQAQHAIAGAGDQGSTTSDGNGFWVAAQLAFQRGESEAAFSASDRACRAGTAIACSVAGEMIIQGKIAMGTPEQSAALFQRGCELGNANACQGLGLMLVQGIGIAADSKRGQAAMSKACQASNATACANLGLMHKMGMFGASNLQEANHYLKKALSLQPENEVALQALADMKANENSSPSPTSRPQQSGPVVQPTELRGRLTVNPLSSSPAVGTRMDCWSNFTAHWNLARDASPAKPNWDRIEGPKSAKFDDTETIGALIIAAGGSGRREGLEANGLTSCQSHYEADVRMLVRQPWAIAPNALSPNTLLQFNPILGQAYSSAAGDLTLLVITDTQASGPRRITFAKRGIALFRINCDTAAAAPLFYFETDAQGKISPSRTQTPPPTALSGRASVLGCTPPAERRLWTELSGLEAALSLRFEQDQQQTP